MKKEDFKIVKKDKFFHVFYKEKFLFLFNNWIELKWYDNKQEVPIQFNTHKEALSFVESFAD